MSDRKLVEALVHNWFESVEEEVGGQRRHVLLTVMASVLKRVETTVYKEILRRSSLEDLQKLGLDDATREVCLQVLQASLDANPLFIRFLAYSQLSGKTPVNASPVVLFVPGDDRPHTMRELFPKETGKLAGHLNKIAQFNTSWIDKPGATIFKNYLFALSQLYSETDTKKGVEHQKTVSYLYKQLVESDFPILLVPALEGYIKEPYLDPELRVS